MIGERTSEQNRVSNMLRRQGQHLEAKLFNLTCNFDLEDWRAVRDESYWNILNTIPVRDSQRRFSLLLIRVEAYLKSK